MFRTIYTKVVLYFFQLFISVCSSDKIILDNKVISNDDIENYVCEKRDILKSPVEFSKRNEDVRTEKKMDVEKETLQSIRMPMSFF